MKCEAIGASQFRLEHRHPDLQERYAFEHGGSRHGSRAVNGKTNGTMSPFRIAERSVRVHHLHEGERNQDPNPKKDSRVPQVLSFEFADGSHCCRRIHSCHSEGDAKIPLLDFRFLLLRCHAGGR